MHPLSSAGSAILAVPMDLNEPVQVQIPPRHLLLWRGDLEHCGDEWLIEENIALFANLNPSKSVFQAERGANGEVLTFASGRPHSQVRLDLPNPLRS